MNYYAHSLAETDQSKWHILEDHLRDTAKLAASFAEPFASEDWAWNVSWIHDMGKATNAFQKYLAKSNGLDDLSYGLDDSSSNHATAGAAWAEKYLGKCVGRILAYLTAGHHTGLPDYESDRTGAAALSVRMEEGNRNLPYVESYFSQLENNLLKIN
ncbi:MAG: CRISPR-associated endonuclease Cas3'', partial [Lentisphaerae bacterium]|nr:CRISPR-associated endonuclease Cas3'' [Lentisphaerota bacterium]